MPLALRLVTAAVVELLFVVATRLLLRYFPWSSVEAELARSALRIVTAGIYWLLFRPLIQSRTPNLEAFRSPALLFGVLLLLSIPVVVGRYQLAPAVAVLFALASVPVAVKEEFLFRGVVQNVLAEKCGTVKGVFFTSVVFTAWHIGVWSPTPWVFSQLFVVSVLVGLIYAYSGSMLAVVALHTAYDAVFSFTPLIPSPLPENWGFVPLLASAALVSYWAFARGTAPLRAVRG